MRKLFVVLAAAVLGAAFPSSASGQPRNSEQVVFSGVAAGNTVVGFWIWCEAESENPYAGACQGSMYFYELGITRHVAGFITESEEVEGEYTMTVFSTLDDAVACSLTNGPPLAQGPHSTVTVECSEPVADASTDTAVVVVTGPKR